MRGFDVLASAKKVLFVLHNNLSVQFMSIHYLDKTDAFYSCKFIVLFIKFNFFILNKLLESQVDLRIKSQRSEKKTKNRSKMLNKFLIVFAVCVGFSSAGKTSSYSF